MIDPRSDFNAHIDAPVEIDEQVDDEEAEARQDENANKTKA